MVRHYRYLVVGGGMAADAAARGIREVDSSGEIAVVSAEADPPYARPPLSKALWKGSPLESIWLNTQTLGVDLFSDTRIVALDRAQRLARDDRGVEYRFEKLLLATGGTPRRLERDSGAPIYFRTLADYRQLRALADSGGEFAVLGAGFIGSEIAAALALAGCKVTMVFPESGIGARLFPSDLAQHLVGYYRERGVDVIPDASVQAVEREGTRLVLRLDGGRRVVADGVVAGLGIVPNVELALAAGLEVGDGIIVDRFLRTSDADIFAAGDVANFFSPHLGSRMRVEHEDNALTMGEAAGRAMAGAEAEYTHLPFFYSDLFDLGYEAVGDLDPRSEVVADWKREFEEGVIYYLRDTRVRGVLLWNVWGQVQAARDLIAQPGPFSASDLRGAIGS
ncbi:MAG TPA: FAD-dependent oxidoreductase [Gemmatimonadaceae bacterium]|nr:FAD-dependent oxidoreductase [Gemmatimonadaceae bacterium]